MPSKDDPLILRLSTADPLNCILYTDAGAQYRVSTSLGADDDRIIRRFGRSTELVTIRLAKRPEEVIGSVRRGLLGWSIELRRLQAPDSSAIREALTRSETSEGWKLERTRFRSFFGWSVFTKVMKRRPKMRDTSGKLWIWQGYRSNKPLYLLSPTEEVAARFRESDPEREQDPMAALIVYKAGEAELEMIVVGWLALERKRRAKQRRPSTETKKSQASRSSTEQGSICACAGEKAA